ncbi:DNA polymerase IV [Sneathiella chinensis]|uniref:DNA polymerase IV n=1 Tax=Sneathiella chinensis TaxID=349750 RepID=A0ABQ5U8M1_9PROT|nr:DNA polymerase IV [Sneathiella chinensis]GLQ07677.1 DNA polymerase IV [Sneathiella chinensis]
MTTLCRTCFRVIPEKTTPDGEPVRLHRCPACRSPRLVRHPELLDLSIAHMDCDAFYAAVEKRDNPELLSKPVIMAYDAPRSVVSTCCYIARMSGVRSAMPLYKAKKLCPDGVIVTPRMAVYSEVSKAIHTLFQKLTPSIEPLSLDEAYLDLSGTEKLHGRSPAQSMMWLAAEIRKTIGITVSVGLSYNKYLAKLASDLDKPDGFAVIGRQEAVKFLAPRPVSDIWGVGKALNQKLARDGISTIGQLQHREERDLVARYGQMGSQLFHLSRGQDKRRVTPRQKAKSISAETTFATDTSDMDILLARLWPLCEKVSARLKASDKAGSTITLKLKTGDFKTLTRSHTLPRPTQLAETLYQLVKPVLEKEAVNKKFRLIGIGVSSFGKREDADAPDLLDRDSGKRKTIESAIDQVRQKFGTEAIGKGRSLPRKK